MRNIPLSIVPNQSFSIVLEEKFYNITLNEIGGVMATTIIRDNAIVIQGCRIVSGFPLIPYLYKENGNFAFLTLNNEYPYWTKFNTSQNLFYLTIAELEQIRGT